jgi:YebC/PmpR family DNA-binding regulatory protein
MSGHSKWSQIKRKKAVTDAKRGKMFTRLIKEIQIAARLGGPDLDGNPRLRLAIDIAKKSSMPADNIARAIARGAGQEGSGALDELTYELYGPGGIAIMVETATDNKNRTVGEMRHLVGKYGGVLGDSGSVSWMFSKRGLIEIPAAEVDEDSLMLAALDSGADDVKHDDPDYFEVQTSPETFEAVRTQLEKSGYPIEEARNALVAANLIRVAGEESAKLVKLLEAIEDNDDVQNVYTNADIQD